MSTCEGEAHYHNIHLGSCPEKVRDIPPRYKVRFLKGWKGKVINQGGQS
jgi:hypothetical protein